MRMVKSAALFCILILGSVIAANPARAGEQNDDCEARMRKLDASQAEGADRLAEKNEVIEYCGRQYKRDQTIEHLVKQCAKYEEQPIIKQQFVAECMLAAYGYANAFYALKAEYGK
jgi:hypothetical protein